MRDARPPLVVISRSHSDSELEEYLQQLGEHQTTSIGSSLKFCLVAEGQAQLYPVSGRRTSGIRRQGMRWRRPLARMCMTGRGKPLDYTRASHS